MHVATALIMIAAAALAVGSTYAAARGRLGVNRLAGIRLRRVMASPEAWRAGHRAALVPVTAGSLLTVAAALASVVATGSSEATEAAWTLASAAVLAMGLVFGAWRANRAAADVLAQDEATPRSRTTPLR